MNKSIAYAFIFLGLLAGCSNQESYDEVHPVSWYKEHKQEQINTIEKCHENQGELKDNPNCINAKQANILSISGELPTFD